MSRGRENEDCNLVANPLVSVIVPVYKVENYLVRCLESLSRQSLRDIEILLVDDASPDRCGEICDEYAIKDLRFRVFHNKTNQGLSVARNIGISKATCDYLMFVDSDDWVHEDFCKEAYNCAVRYQAELVIFRFQHIKKTEHGREYGNTNDLMHSGYKTQLETIDLLQEHTVGNYAWNKLYKKDLFTDISYPAGRYFEDIGTTYKIVLAASRIYFFDKVLYYYCYRADSITASKTEKHLKSHIKMFMQQYHDLVAWGYPADKLDVFLEKLAFDYCIKKKNDVDDSYYTFCANALRNRKSVPAHFTWKLKILFVLFKHCKPLFDLVCYLYNTKVC